VAGVSAYDFRIPAPDLLPTPAEAARFIGEVKASHPAVGDVQAEVDGWCRPATG
jgi:hypothetical protein